MGKNLVSIKNEGLLWEDTFTEAILHTSDFQKIFFFFTIFTPCTDLSCRGKSLKSYRWDDKKVLKDFLIKQKSIEIQSGNTYEELEAKLQESDLKNGFPEDTISEKIYIRVDDNELMSIFRHLRNSFAHGRFNVIDSNGEQYFLFEDRSTRIDKKKNTYPVSARMILRKSTLLKWITIIEGGEKPYKKEV